MEAWLSLTVSSKGSPGRNRDLAENQLGHPVVFVAVPKKFVRLATRRNRIRRLIKEAVRSDGFFRGGKEYFFKVSRLPEILDLDTVRKVIHDLQA